MLGWGARAALAAQGAAGASARRKRKTGESTTPWKRCRGPRRPGVVELRCFSTPRLLKKRIVGPSSASPVFRLHWGEAGAAPAAGPPSLHGGLQRGSSVRRGCPHGAAPLRCVLASQSLETKASLALASAEEQLGTSLDGSRRTCIGRRRALRTRPEIIPLLSFTFTVRKS